MLPPDESTHARAQLLTAMATGGYVNAAMDTAPQCMVIAPDPLEGKVSVPSTLESIAEQE